MDYHDISRITISISVTHCDDDNAIADKFATIQCHKLKTSEEANNMCRIQIHFVSLFHETTRVETLPCIWSCECMSTYVSLSCVYST